MNLRNATIIYALGKYSKVILQMLVTIILARILTPYDYGIIAIITVFSTFFSAFSDMGFGVAIVQKRWLTKNQIDDIVEQIYKRIEKNERTLITTLTIKMAEELTNYLKKLNIKVAYLHSEIKTLDRLKIIRDLRIGTYDVLVGINLLREGLDIPEVSLITILDADKQGFLRSSRSLIQTIGRAARNSEGHVIMYADTISEAMDIAIKETARRREIQTKYNEEHNIIPKTIIKEIRDVVSNVKTDNAKTKKLTKAEEKKLMIKLEEEMKKAAAELDFERATELRDALFELKSNN